MFNQSTERSSISPIVHEFALFKERYGIQKVVGILGSSRSEEIPTHRCVLSEAVSQLAHSGRRFAILTGGTRGGIPEMGLTIARENGLPTIGVFPEDGEKYALRDQLDLAIRVSRPMYGEVTWGSESSVLVSLLDAAIVIGGELGTTIETSMIMKTNIARQKKKDEEKKTQARQN